MGRSWAAKSLMAISSAMLESCRVVGSWRSRVFKNEVRNEIALEEINKKGQNSVESDL